MAIPGNLSPRELEEAFALFTQASDQLSSAYNELQGEVGRLTSELAGVNAELRTQLASKEALSRRLGLLVESLPGGVLELDPQGRVVMANPGAASLFGPDLLGAAWVDVLEAGFVPLADESAEWVARGPEAQGRRVHVVSRDLPDGSGAIVLVHDVSESHRLRAELELHKRLSAMGEMAAGLAHQLRTPLATAILYTGNLMRPHLQEPERLKFADKSMARLKHLEGLIQEMLLFVRGQAAEQTLLDGDELVEDLVQTMQPQFQAADVHLRVQRTFPTPFRLLGNRKSIAGALINLLENALRAAPVGSEVVFGVGEEGVGRVCFSIRDHGEGIALDMQDRVFEPFFTTRSEGTGLGLAIVRGVAEAHGGHARLSPAEGGGSCFELVLPLAQSA